jgi:hypothetical protein
LYEDADRDRLLRATHSSGRSSREPKRARSVAKGERRRAPSIGPDFIFILIDFIETSFHDFNGLGGDLIDLDE